MRVEGISKPETSGRDEGHTSDGQRERERRVARGTLGAGGKTLKLRSGDGSITVQVW